MILTIVPFLANCSLATLGAVMLTATEYKVVGVILLTFNGLCAVFCALRDTRTEQHKPANNGKQSR